MKFLGVAWRDADNIPEKLQNIIDEMITTNIQDLKSDLVKAIHDQSQILKIKYRLSIALVEMEHLIKEKRFNVTKYYIERYPRELGSTQLKLYVENDTGLSELIAKYEMLKIKLKFFESVFDILKSKPTNIRSIIMWEEYTSGNK